MHHPEILILVFATTMPSALSSHGSIFSSSQAASLETSCKFQVHANTSTEKGWLQETVAKIVSSKTGPTCYMRQTWSLTTGLLQTIYSVAVKFNAFHVSCKEDEVEQANLFLIGPRDEI